jgi:hypothetical protein
MNIENVTLTPEHFKEKSLFIATPCYGGMASANYITSLAKLISFLYMYRIRFHLGLIGNESLITRARNTLTAQFMNDSFSHLIFIDADMEFEPLDVIRMLHYDKDILCGVAPTKTLPPRYAVAYKSKELIEEKFLEAYNIGTAFMMIKKQVFSKLMEAHPELKYDPHQKDCELSDFENVSKYTYALFDTQIETLPNGKRIYLSEDYLFCRRWQNIGGKILIDPTIAMNHVGTHVFEGQSPAETT